MCIVLKGYKTCSSQVFNLVAGSTLNSSAAYLRTAVKGVPSGTPKTWKLVFATIQTNIYIFILYLEGKLWVGGEGDLESDLCRCGCSHSLQERDTFIINVFLHTNAPHGIQFRLHFQGLAWIRKKEKSQKMMSSGLGCLHMASGTSGECPMRVIWVKTHITASDSIQNLFENFEMWQNNILSY